jgi:hypothetical protein
MHDYDKNSKWLIQHHGDSILRLAGVGDIVAWTPLQAKLVQPRRLPDGLLEVRHQGETESDPDPYIVEIATYPEARVADQILDDTALVLLDRRVLPEVVVLFLHARGNDEAASSVDLRSRRGFTTWHVSWRIVKLWEISAADLLATGDLGLIPWVPLADFDDPPETIFRECRARIDRDAPPDEHESLLVVIHFLAGLKYNDRRLFEVLRGRQAMLESHSPILEEVIEERTRRAIEAAREAALQAAREAALQAARNATIDTTRKSIIRFLTARFGPKAQTLRGQLYVIDDHKKLEELTELAGACPDLDAFRAGLMS